MKTRQEKKTIILLLTAFCLYFGYSQQNIIYQNNFEHLYTGQYSENEFKDALDVNFCNGADEGRVAITSFENKGNVLQVKYPKGKVKTNDSGMHTKLFWNHYETFEELYFSYRVYIPSDFEFRAGAKLPGLAYQTRDRNMSLRLMWRNEGLLEFYNHFETRPVWEDWTASVNWSLIDPYDEPGGPQPDQVKLKKGAWNHIEVYHKLNTPGKNDGVMRGWLNGQLAIDITDNGDYRQSDEEDIKLNSIYLSTFFGGSSDDFKPTKDQYAYFDDFVVSKSRIGYNDSGDETGETLSVAFKNPVADLTLTEGYDLDIEVTAIDTKNAIKEVNLYINDIFIRKERVFPYTWGHDGSPNPQELNALAPGSYTIKAIATNIKGESKVSSFTLTILQDMDNCNFELPSTSGLVPLDNEYFNYVHVSGTRNSEFLNNILKFSVKWNPQYNELSKFAINTTNGQPDWYVDFSKTAQFQLKNSNPEITLINTGIDGLDGNYWITKKNGELILKCKDNSKLICFSNVAQAPSCMEDKSETSIISKHSDFKISLYPNPASSFIQLKGVKDKNSTISIINLQGQLVKSDQISDNDLIDITTIPSGYYFLKVEEKYGTHTLPFIKD